MTTATPTKLSAAQARQLAKADAEVKQLDAKLDAAKAARRELYDRHLERIPLSEKPDEAEKGIRMATAGGYTIRVTPKSSGERFSLTKYLDAGHEITKEMREALSSSSYLSWTIKRKAGPYKPGSVEPS